MGDAIYTSCSGLAACWGKEEGWRLYLALVIREDSLGMMCALCRHKKEATTTS